MAFSSVSNRSPSTVRPIRRQHSQPALWAIAFISFILGSAATTLVIWQLHELYQATVAPLVSVEGTVRAQYSYRNGDDLTPPPTGYYVEAAGLSRVYLTGDQPMEPYVGQPVVASGSVSGICGPKSLPCYTLLNVREIGAPEASE